MIDLDEKSLDEVRHILRDYAPGIEARVFGSRVSGASRKYSDLDIVLVGDDAFSIARLEEIRNAFSESDLPIQVDILDWQAISPAFKTVIERRYEIIQPSAR